VTVPFGSVPRLGSGGAGAGTGASVSPISGSSIFVPAVPPVGLIAPIGPMSMRPTIPALGPANLQMPGLGAAARSGPPLIAVSAASASSQNPEDAFQFASKALASPFRMNKLVLAGLVIVLGLCGYIGGTWIMDQLARRRAREHS